VSAFAATMSSPFPQFGIVHFVFTIWPICIAAEWTSRAANVISVMHQVNERAAFSATESSHIIL
jgi:hypothetical protein